MRGFKRFMQVLKPADYIALAIIITGTLLKAMHIDGIVDASIIAIVSFYFGQKIRSLRND